MKIKNLFRDNYKVKSLNLLWFTLYVKSKSKQLNLIRIHLFLTWFKIPINIILINLKWLITMIGYNKLDYSSHIFYCWLLFLSGFMEQFIHRFTVKITLELTELQKLTLYSELTSIIKYYNDICFFKGYTIIL